jgi:antitoxin FitA
VRTLLSLPPQYRALGRKMVLHSAQGDLIDIGWKDEMADLLVRGVDEEIVRALKERAGEHGRSAEAEHREILAAALLRPRKRSFAEVLASMPESARMRILNEGTGAKLLNPFLPRHDRP